MQGETKAVWRDVLLPIARELCSGCWGVEAHYGQTARVSVCYDYTRASTDAREYWAFMLYESK
jgi:hypothetical protein